MKGSTMAPARAWISIASFWLVAVMMPTAVAAAEPSLDRYVGTLPGFVGRALVDDDRLARARADLEAAGKRLERSRGARLPTVDLSLNSGRTRKRSDAVTAGPGAQFGTDEYGYYDSNRARLQLTQGIWLGGEREAAIDQAKAAYRKAKLDFERARGERIFAITQAYWRMQADRKRVDAAAAAVNELVGLSAIVERRAAADLMSAPVAARVQRRLLDARATLEDARGSYSVARKQFRRETGLGESAVPQRDPVGLGGDEVRLPPYSRLSDQVIEHNPAFGAAREAAIARTAQIDAARSALMPRLLLDAYTQEEESPGGYDGTEETAGIGLRLEWNLFNGSRDSAAIDAARADREAALAQVREIGRDIRSEAESAHAEIMRLTATLAEARASHALALRVVEGYRRLFEQGQRSPVAVADVIVEQLGAYTRVVRLSTQRHLQHYRYLNALGLLGRFRSSADKG